MNANVAGVDSIVGEYLIYRGFTQAFQALEIEKVKDRTKKFEVSRIVESIFQSLTTYDIEHFVLLWDFLSKRFFLHLDTEHVQLCGILKSDLIKFYLINAIRCKNRDKVTEFFSMYSHEILAESGNFIPGNLRSWFVLPYMEEPEKDQEFSVYFSTRWSELLRVTLHNFLSVVMSSAPPPKLLLLEKWFRSEAQQEMRLQLKLSSKKIDCLITRIESYELKLQEMRDIMKTVVTTLHKANISAPSKTSTSGGLFENDDVIEGKQEKVKELGHAISKLATDCCNKSHIIAQLPKVERQKEILGEEYSALEQASEASQSGNNPAIHNILQPRHQHELEELESELLTKLHEWVALMASK